MKLKFDDVLQVVRVSVATTTKRFSIDKISRASKLVDLDIVDELAIAELKVRTLRALSGQKQVNPNHFFARMRIDPTSTIKEAAHAALTAYESLPGDDGTDIKGLTACESLPGDDGTDIKG